MPPERHYLARNSRIMDDGRTEQGATPHEAPTQTATPPRRLMAVALVHDLLAEPLNIARTAEAVPRQT